jgi:predicted component of type VI protein secretion system
MSFLNQFLDDSPRDDLLASIRRHLHNVLGGHRDFASYVHPIGLGQYSAHSTSRNLATALMQEILENVAEHEPRMQAAHVTVNDQDADHFLNLILHGEVTGRACLFHIAIHLPLGFLAVVDARWAERGEKQHVP